ncbi:MAG: glycerophosphodiester phosphodiesterase family protein [Steroidobacteraceae bacterium]
MTTTGQWGTLNGRPPVVIAHRGASGYRPEHTLESYALAIEMGADYIEPDLVSTLDGELIARHEPLLDATTNVSSLPQFAARKSTRVMDGVVTTGFFACDFTLEEIRQLRAMQPNPARSKEYDGRLLVPTFDEILQLLVREQARRGRVIGVYPETKHPAFHCALGLPLEDRMLDLLGRYELDHAQARVWLQSFESANLQYMRRRTALPMAQLIDVKAIRFDANEPQFDIANYDDPRGAAAPRTLSDIAGYAQALAPWKRIIVPARDAIADAKNDGDRETLPPRALIAAAHEAGLEVHTWTFRNEPGMLARNYQGDPSRELTEFFALGIDGVFADFPDTAVAARATC